MTTETYPGPSQYTIAGTGPYAIGFEYTQGAIKAGIITAEVVTYLPEADYTVDPEIGEDGNLTLSAGAAAAHAGEQLYIERDTPLEQGWVGVSAREQGLATQLDRTAQTAQENKDGLARALRTTQPIAPLVMQAGHMIVGRESDGQPEVRSIEAAVAGFIGVPTDYGVYYSSTAALLASGAASRGEGALWVGGPDHYLEALPTATDAHVEIEGSGVKLYAQARRVGEYTLDQVGLKPGGNAIDNSDQWDIVTDRIGSGSTLIVPFDPTGKREYRHTRTIQWNRLNLSMVGENRGNRSNVTDENLLCSAIRFDPLDPATAGPAMRFGAPTGGGTAKELQFKGFMLKGNTQDYLLDIEGSWTKFERVNLINKASGGSGLHAKGAFGSQYESLFCFKDENARTGNSTGIWIEPDPDDLEGIFYIVGGTTMHSFATNYKFGSETFTPPDPGGLPNSTRMLNIVMIGAQTKSGGNGADFLANVESALVLALHAEGCINTSVRVRKGARGLTFKNGFITAGDTSDGSLMQIGQGGGVAEDRYFSEIEIENMLFDKIPEGEAGIAIAADPDIANAHSVRIGRNKYRENKNIDPAAQAYAVNAVNAACIERIADEQNDETTHGFAFSGGLPGQLRNVGDYANRVADETLGGGQHYAMADHPQTFHQRLNASGGNRAARMADPATSKGLKGIIGVDPASGFEIVLQNSAGAALGATLKPGERLFAFNDGFENAFMAIPAQWKGAATETLSGARQLTKDDPDIISADTNDATNRPFELPDPAGVGNRGLRFHLSCLATSPGSIVVRNFGGGTTYATLAPGTSGVFWNDGINDYFIT